MWATTVRSSDLFSHRSWISQIVIYREFLSDMQLKLNRLQPINVTFLNHRKLFWESWDENEIQNYRVNGERFRVRIPRGVDENWLTEWEGFPSGNSSQIN